MNSATQKETIAGLYHRVASAYGQVGPNIFAYAGQHLVERLGVGEGAQVLYIGARIGANLFPAAKLPLASMLQMDAEQVAFSDASFDYVLCGFAILLFPHLEQALSECFRVLRPGGKLGITIAQHLDALSHWYGEHITDYHTRYHFP